MLRAVVISALVGIALGGCGSISKSILKAKLEVAPQLRAESIARIKDVQSRISKEELDAGCGKVFARSPIAIARTRIATEWRASVSHTCFARTSSFAKLLGDDPLMAAYVANAGHKYDFSDDETPTLVSCVVSIDKDGKASFRRGPTKGDANDNCHAIQYLPR